jgi:hypothetical protein
MHTYLFSPFLVFRSHPIIPSSLILSRPLATGLLTLSFSPVLLFRLCSSNTAVSTGVRTRSTGHRVPGGRGIRLRNDHSPPLVRFLLVLVLVLVLLVLVLVLVILLLVLLVLVLVLVVLLLLLLLPSPSYSVPFFFQVSIFLLSSCSVHRNACCLSQPLCWCWSTDPLL